MAMSNDSASAGAALFAATNMSMFAMIEANRAAQRQQTIMAVINNKEYVMDNKLLQQLKDEGIEITVTVMDNFGIKGRIADFDIFLGLLSGIRSDINIQISDLGRFFTLVAVTKMNGFQPDNARYLLFADGYVSSDNYLFVNTADTVEF